MIKIKGKKGFKRVLADKRMPVCPGFVEARCYSLPSSDGTRVAPGVYDPGAQ